MNGHYFLTTHPLVHDFIGKYTSIPEACLNASCWQPNLSIQINDHMIIKNIHTPIIMNHYTGQSRDWSFNYWLSQPNWWGTNIGKLLTSLPQVRICLQLIFIRLLEMVIIQKVLQAPNLYSKHADRVWGLISSATSLKNYNHLILYSCPVQLVKDSYWGVYPPHNRCWLGMWWYYFE